jgi:hypothetical protein
LQYGVLSIERSKLSLQTESTLVIRASNSQQTFALTVSRQMLIKPNPPEELPFSISNTNSSAQPQILILDKEGI